MRLPGNSGAWAAGPSAKGGACGVLVVSSAKQGDKGTFPQSRHDDQIDAISQFLEWASQEAPIRIRWL